MIIPAHVPRIGVCEAIDFLEYYARAAIELDRGRPLLQMPGERTQRIAEPLARDPQRHHRRLPAGQDQPVEPVEVGGHPDLPAAHADPVQQLGVCLKVALQRQHPDARGDRLR
jgi:hypothetical protein